MATIMLMLMIVFSFAFVGYLIIDVEEAENGVQKAMITAVVFIMISFAMGYFKAVEDIKNPEPAKDSKFVIRWIK